MDDGNEFSEYQIFVARWQCNSERELRWFYRCRYFHFRSQCIIAYSSLRAHGWERCHLPPVSLPSLTSLHLSHTKPIRWPHPRCVYQSVTCFAIYWRFFDIETKAFLLCHLNNHSCTTNHELFTLCRLCIIILGHFERSLPDLTISLAGFS